MAGRVVSGELTSCHLHQWLTFWCIFGIVHFTEFWGVGTTQPSSSLSARGRVRAHTACAPVRACVRACVLVCVRSRRTFSSGGSPSIRFARSLSSSGSVTSTARASPTQCSCARSSFGAGRPCAGVSVVPTRALRHEAQIDLELNTAGARAAALAEEARVKGTALVKDVVKKANARAVEGKRLLARQPASALVCERARDDPPEPRSRRGGGQQLMVRHGSSMCTPQAPNESLPRALRVRWRRRAQASTERTKRAVLFIRHYLRTGGLSRGGHRRAQRGRAYAPRCICFVLGG